MQSVRLEELSDCAEAVVAFTDIKAASQAYNEDQMLKGAVPLSVAFCDAIGTSQSDARFPTASCHTDSNLADLLHGNSLSGRELEDLKSINHRDG